MTPTECPKSQDVGRHVAPQEVADVDTGGPE